MMRGLPLEYEIRPKVCGVLRSLLGIPKFSLLKVLYASARNVRVLASDSRNRFTSDVSTLK